MQKCTHQEMKPLGAIRLQHVDLSMEDGMTLQYQDIEEDVTLCQLLMCTACGYIELIELSGVVHDEETAIAYSASSYE